MTRGGALAAFVVGTLTFGSGGVAFAAVLLAFFIPSVLLSRLGRARKRRLVDIEKGGARDAAQVLANGGVATVCAVLAGTFSVGRTPFLWFAAFAGAYAAATADTWGTEIGTLAARPPRSILTLRPTAAGLSGGVTLPGTVAEIAGALGIAVVAAFAWRLVPYASRLAADEPGRLVLAVAVAGVAGALADSVLGATLQELRRCPACERTCETNPHACGTPTQLVRGIRSVGNDFVNAAATLTGAVTAFVLAL